ncbi:MAG: hypothetical protein ACLS89_00695 [Collinsella sp.]
MWRAIPFSPRASRTPSSSTGKSDAVNAVCAYVNDNGEGLDAAVEGGSFGH